MPSQEGCRVRPPQVQYSHSVRLGGQTPVRSLGPEVAPRSRDPWNPAVSSQEGRAEQATAGTVLAGSEMEDEAHLTQRSASGPMQAGPTQGVLQNQPGLKTL